MMMDKTSGAKKLNHPTPNESKENIQEFENKILTEALNNIDKDIFFSSATAGKKTAGVIKKRVEVLMLSVYEKINSAINKGEYNVEVELNKTQRSFLENKGYRVSLKSGGANDIYRCVIYWN